MATKENGCSPDSFTTSDDESLVDEDSPMHVSADREHAFSDVMGCPMPSLGPVPSSGLAASSLDGTLAGTFLSSPEDAHVDMRHDDVLLGRGKFANNRAGNRYYRYLLVGNCDAYARCTSQKAKVAFTTLLANEVKIVGRFLQSVEGGNYREISDAKARVKVGQDLRYQAKLQKCAREKAATEHICATGTLSLRLESTTDNFGDETSWTSEGADDTIRHEPLDNF